MAAHPAESVSRRHALVLPAGITIQGVIFDLDGTLLDTESVLDSCIAETCLKDFGLIADAASLHAVRGLKDHGIGGWPSTLLARLEPEVWALALEDDTATVKGEALFSAVDARFAIRAGSTPAMPGAVRIVRSLASRRIPLAIATSSMREAFNVKRVPHEDTLFAHFHSFICVEDVQPRAKPMPDAFLKAAKALGLDPSVCIAVEDSIPGVTAALAAGCFVIATPILAHKQAVVTLGAHLVLDSLDEWDVDSHVF
jgi:HAD superfamily hydrolase (TIGR01509 family)